MVAVVAKIFHSNSTEFQSNRGKERQVLKIVDSRIYYL